MRYGELTCEEAADEMRKKHEYRRLILSGRLVLPHKSAAQLLGPDCLYHLYSQQETADSRPRKEKGSAKKRKPAERLKAPRGSL